MKVGKITVVAVCLALILSMFTAVGLAEENNIDEHVKLVTGTVGVDYPEITKDWEQGDFVALRFNKDAWFVVIYGTEENPNGILLMSIYTRYLGVAEVYDEYGGYAGTVPIPVFTVFGQKLVWALEFRDMAHGGQEPNGVFDFKRTPFREPSKWRLHEPLYKAVDLNRSWERSNITEKLLDNNTKEWTFSLTATDMEYEKFSPFVDVSDKSVEKMEFTFHLTATASDVVIEDVPWYKVTITSNADNEVEVIDSEFMGTETYTGTSVNAEFKYDHLIEGWDFETNESKLLIETWAILGNFIPKHVAQWIRQEFIRDEINGSGRAEYETREGVRYSDSEELESGEDENNDGIPDPEIITKDTIEFKDNWQRIGRLLWLSNVTVDGEDKDMYFQIHAGRILRNVLTEKRDGCIKGAIILGGFIYPKGEKIFHDPTFESTALLLDIPQKLIDILPVGIVFVQFLMAVVAVISVSGYAYARKRKERQRSFQFDAIEFKELNEYEHLPPR